VLRKESAINERNWKVTRKSGEVENNKKKKKKYKKKKKKILLLGEEGRS